MADALYFLALATDFDDTIANEGLVDPSTWAALAKFKKTGRRLILVTGRELPEVKSLVPDIGLFDRVVAENGALLYDPKTEKARAISAAPPAIFVEQLRARNVEPLSVGESIVATREPYESIVLDVIRELGLELQIIFNKGAVMVLPTGMNKAKGLKAALVELGLSPHNVVAVGDAENDHAFLKYCGCSAAVANALPMVKETADIVLAGEREIGVRDLLEQVCGKDGALLPPGRFGLPLGKTEAGDEIFLPPYGGSILIAGASGVGKSTLATTLTELMVEKKFEFCVFDPEGDYSALDKAIAIGNAKEPPVVEETITLIRKLEANVVVNTQALEAAERPPFFAELLTQLSTLRARTGRPHWLLIDDAHNLLPADRGNLAEVLPDRIPAAIFITVHPEAVSSEALETVDTVLALGKSARKTIEAFCDAMGLPAPSHIPAPADDQVLLWRPKDKAAAPVLITVSQPKQARLLRSKKYAEGELGADVSFFFRGPEGKLKLRAQNLALFKQIAEGVDDETWTYHLKLGEYSEWFREVIKDRELADEAAAIETDAALSADQSRKRIGDAISKRYTAPAREGKG